MAGRACIPIVLGLCCVTGPPALAQRSVQVSGLVYAGWHLDFGPGAAGGNRFEVNRAYVTLSGRTSERVRGRITTDAIQGDGEKLEIRLKYAYATYDLPGGTTSFRFGLTPTPFLDVEETVWDHRMHASMPADQAGFLCSSDLGVAVDGRWGHDERVQVTAGLYNGEGWANGTGDAGKDLMARATVRLLASDDRSATGGLRLTGYGHLGRPTGGGDRHRAIGMLTWQSRRLSVGGQLLLARDRTDAADGEAATARDARLANGFVVYRVPGSTVALLGRLSRLDRDRNVGADAVTRVLGGISARLAPELRVMASVEHASYTGGAPTPAAEATRRQARLQMALAF